MSLEGCVIGLIEDDPVMGESLAQSLTLEGCHVEWWKTGAEALRALRASDPDLIVCDIRLPDMNGEEIFTTLAKSASVPPFLFMTAYGTIDQAVALMRAGAGDYVTKPFEVASFMARADSLIHRHPRSRADECLGVSDKMREIEAALRRIAHLTAPVLVTGETGAGKEVCARFLHSISPRSKEPFVAVNCAAIPADRMDSEMFGSKGTTGGHGFHRGFAERARGGVLFLDEVSELPLAMQAKLLRVVETREFHRLGGEQTVPFHGRIVCATNADLTRSVAQAQFRADLFYRINGFRIEVPPLRQRTADIAWLLDLFFERFRTEGQGNLRGISTLVQDIAHEHVWPGNVRELRNRVERAMIMARGDWIMPADMFPDLDAAHPMLTAFATLSETRDSAERRQIERALRQTDGQISETAKLLDISRTTLWEKMKRLDITGFSE